MLDRLCLAEEQTEKSTPTYIVSHIPSFTLALKASIALLSVMPTEVRNIGKHAEASSTIAAKLQVTCVDPHKPSVVL